MRIGCCTLLLDKRDPLFRDSLRLIKAWGYDYIEAPLTCLLELDCREFASYQQAVADAGLPVEVFNFAIPPYLNLVGPLASSPGEVDQYIRRSIDIASRLNTGLITMCGPIRKSNNPVDWEGDGRAQYAQFLSKIGAMAAEHNIELAIEPICHEEQGYVSTLEEAARCIALADRTNIGLMVDFYHFFRQCDNMAILLHHSGNLPVHLHFAIPGSRRLPRSGDEQICDDLLLPLLNRGYRNRISLEAHTNDPKADLPAAMSLMERYR